MLSLDFKFPALIILQYNAVAAVLISIHNFSHKLKESEDFILRWGTHYIKWAQFGGRLELRKVASASRYSTQEEFAVEAKVDFDSFFASFHAKSSKKEGSSSTKESSYSSTSILAIGGSQEIAALVTDEGSPTIKTDMLNWLDSIPDYPKAFKFGIGTITEVLYFRPENIFPTVDYGNCGERGDLKTDSLSGKQYYEVDKLVANVTVKAKVFCNYKTKDQFLAEITARRNALEHAIGIYLSEGLVSDDEITVNGGNSYCELSNRETPQDTKSPGWGHMKSGKPFSIIFDMEEDVDGGNHGSTIPKDQIFMMQYYAGKWFVESIDGKVRLTDGYSNGGSDVSENLKISVKGIVLTFNPEVGLFRLTDEDYDASIVYWPTISAGLKGQFIARASWPVNQETPDTDELLEERFMTGTVQRFPCNTHWSNLQLIDPTHGGLCLFFSAVSEGSIYVVFASVPKDKTTWYYVEISTALVAIYKYNHVLIESTIKNAKGIGDAVLHQSYFVCVHTLLSNTRTIIEYGKYTGDEEKITYLTYIDKHSNIVPNFYAFGSGNEDVTIFQLRMLDRSPPSSTQCGKGTKFDADKKLCVMDCDENCHPDYGCMIRDSGMPSPRLCNECKDIKLMLRPRFECSSTCPFSTINVGGSRICQCNWFENKCVESCPAEMYPDPDSRQCVVKNDGPWRADLRCGSAYPQSNGSPTQCDPDSESPCCSTTDWCVNFASCEDKSTDICDSSATTPCSVRCPVGCASASRMVWGTDYYTGESSLCKAAVHYGSITDKDGGLVQVNFRDGDNSYAASTKNYITTTTYGASSVTFWFGDKDVMEANCEYKATDVCDSSSATPCSVRCPAGCASASRTVWGTDYYGGDSSLCKAAIHYGAITDDGGVVQVYFRDGNKRYTAATRNGVTSLSYGEMTLTFWFDSDVSEAECEDKSTDVCESSSATACGVRCPAGCASASRTVWGTNYYTGDSSLCKAAVHYGSITDEDGGVVYVYFRGGDGKYTPSTRNGISSIIYGANKLTFWFGDREGNVYKISSYQTHLK
ncbi:uncharacterized protein LOC144439760 [Glandiceps talaboti]